MTEMLGSQLKPENQIIVSAGVGDYADPLNTVRDKLEVVREEQRQARVRQREIDKEKAKRFCEENPASCKKPQPTQEPTVPATSNCGWYLSSWYGSLSHLDGHQDGFHGRTAANGSRFNTHALTVAHKTLPFGTRIQIRRKDGTFVNAAVTDRGPFSGSRVFDLSRGAALVAATSQGSSLYSQGVGSIYICW